MIGNAKLGKGGRWWTQAVENTFYEYDSFSNPDRLQKQEYSYTVYDAPEEEQTLGDILHEGAIGEYSGYDELLGRRIATWRCEAVDSTEIDWGPTGVCKAKSVMHDYYGLSQRVAATRLSPWRYVEDVYVNVGDEFHESYTYGPVGVTARTVETEDTDPEDNFDHWVLPDLFGGTSALLLYDAEPHERALATEHFDAFGVRVAKGSGWGLNLDGSRNRWRSQEGSEADDLHRNDPDEGVYLSPPTLVYMQTRHYDPALGRFIMADSIPMGAFSPQGLNRYAYCTNDPVNLSDPSGRIAPLLGALLIALLVTAALSLLAIGFIAGEAIAQSGWDAPCNLTAYEVGGIITASGLGGLFSGFGLGGVAAPIYAGIVKFLALSGGAAVLTHLGAAVVILLLAFIIGFGAGYLYGKIFGYGLERDESRRRRAPDLKMERPYYCGLPRPLRNVALVYA